MQPYGNGRRPDSPSDSLADPAHVSVSVGLPDGRSPSATLPPLQRVKGRGEVDACLHDPGLRGRGCRRAQAGLWVDRMSGQRRGVLGGTPVNVVGACMGSA